MKKNIKTSAVLIMIYALVSVICAQETKIIGGFKVARGERPHIDLSSVKSDAYEPGVLVIKIKPEIEAKMPDTRFISTSSKGYVETGLISFDEVNSSVGAKLYDRKFDALYETGKEHVSEKFKERHRAWGFHLIYKISIDENADVIETVKQYAALPGVEYAEPVYKIELTGSFSSKWTPDDSSFDQQWHFSNTGQTIGGQAGIAGADCRTATAWDKETGNSNVIVAFVDTGIQYDHPDLAPNIWAGKGWNFVNRDSIINPDIHGTHVSGLVAAVSNNGIGGAGVAGGDGSTDSGVKIMNCQVFDGIKTGGFDLAQIWASDNGASISNNSWTHSSPDYYNQDVLDAIDYFNVNGGGSAMAGGLVICGAGNSGAEEHYYPAYYSGTIAVAGHDNTGQAWPGTVFGDWVDITAPAVNLYSASYPNSYLVETGTSGACPHVSGAAALIISKAYGLLTNTQVREFLESSVWNIYSYETDPIYNGKLGSGALDASAALDMAISYAGGVPRAVNFTASAVSSSEIALGWQNNSFNDDVLITWAYEGGTIGSPADGVSYSAGHTLPGGGIVIFSGNGTSFNHTALNFSTKYVYKIWSRAASDRQDVLNDWYYTGDYTNVPAEASAVTQCGIYAPDFSQDFNFSTSLPYCWSLNGSYSWNIGTFVNGLTGTTGNYPWVVIDGNTAGQADIVSPQIDFSQYQNVTVNFNHSYNHGVNGLATFSYSLNGGTSWNVVSSWTVSTGTINYSNTITALDGSPDVIFKWTLANTGNKSGTRSWSFDDVSITAVSVVPGTPTNVTTEISGSNIIISWDAVAGTTGYDVYSSNTPYEGYTFETSVAINEYTVACADSKKFYYIKSKN